MATQKRVDRQTQDDGWVWWKDAEIVFAILLFPAVLVLCGLGVVITAILGG